MAAQETLCSDIIDVGLIKAIHIENRIKRTHRTLMISVTVLSLKPGFRYPFNKSMAIDEADTMTIPARVDMEAEMINRKINAKAISGRNRSSIWGTRRSALGSCV